jgi:hypothetical protein
MKILLPLIILFVPISIFAKQICIAPSGCKIEMDTGFCPKCIFEKDEPIIKEEKVVVEKKPIVKVSNPPLFNGSLVSQSKPKRECSQKWVCVVPPCDFIDADGCLIGD